MAKEFAKTFYNSAAWRKCRRAYIDYRVSIDGGLCEKCKQEQGHIVHHKEELTKKNINNPNITLDFNNLRYDCKYCHDREEAHAFIKKKKRRYKFKENGDTIIS